MKDNDSTLIVEDFNYNYNDHNKSIKIDKVLGNFGFIQILSGFSNLKSKTLIDLLFTDNLEILNDVNFVENLTETCDHKALKFCLKFKKLSKNENIVITKDKDVKKGVDINELKSLSLQLDSIDCPNHFLWKFNEETLSIINRSHPKINKQVKHYKYPKLVNDLIHHKSVISQILHKDPYKPLVNQLTELKK